MYSPGRGSSLLLSVAGHAGGARVHPAPVWAHRPCSVARFLGGHSRAIWEVTTGSHYPPKQSQTERWKPTQNKG